MEHWNRRHTFGLLLVLILSVGVGRADVLGITFTNSWLVSFDPQSGVISQWHTQLDPIERFVGLAYNPTTSTIYASAQVSDNLYSIDPISLQTKKLGSKQVGGGVDITSLAFDTNNGVLYATAVDGFGNSRLYAIETGSGVSPILVGTLDAPYVDSLSFNPDDGNLYGYSVPCSGPADSPCKASLIRIDPSDAQVTTLFQTPYHTVLGLAKIPGEDAYYTWVNSTSHTYGRLDVATSTISLLGDSDPVGVDSPAMIYQDFFVSSVPEPGSLILLVSGLLFVSSKKRR